MAGVGRFLWAVLVLLVVVVVVLLLLLLVKAPRRVVLVGVWALDTPLQLAVWRAVGSWNELTEVATGYPRNADAAKVEEAGA